MPPAKNRLSEKQYAAGEKTAPEEQKEEDTVTVKLLNSFNGQYGLMFEYQRPDSVVQNIRVIVTPGEYANAIPIEQKIIPAAWRYSRRRKDHPP